MKKLSFNEGYESFRVNDDPNRIVRFNPADPEIMNRLLNLQKEFGEYKPEEDLELNPDGSPKGNLEKGAAFVGEFTRAMRKAVNGIFNADVYDTLFNGQSPLCIVGPKGREKYLFEEIVDALIGVVNPAIEAYAAKSQGKLDKYLGDVEE